MSSQRVRSTSAWRNRDIDWDSWPVQTYLRENYRQLHACDDAVLVHHSAFYRELAPASVAISLELGAGPNLYPLMLASAASRLIHAVDLSAGNVSYLRQQVTRGADASWHPFYDRCRELNPDLAPSLREALASVYVSQSDMAQIPPGGYDLASMNFVAESISEDRGEVAEMCRGFVGTVRPGGHLVASFMENMERYGLGDQSQWPGCPVDASDVTEMFADHVDDLKVTRIDADPSLPEYYGGYTGMIMLTARRRLDRPT